MATQRQEALCPGTCAYAAISVRGKCSWRRIMLLTAHVGVPASSVRSTRSSSARNVAVISKRARPCPAQAWAPCPKPTCRAASRRMSKSAGFAHSRSLRLAEAGGGIDHQDSRARGGWHSSDFSLLRRAPRKGAQRWLAANGFIDGVWQEAGFVLEQLPLVGWFAKRFNALAIALMVVAGRMSGEPLGEAARPFIEAMAADEDRVVLRCRPYATFARPRHGTSTATIKKSRSPTGSREAYLGTRRTRSEGALRTSSTSLRGRRWTPCLRRGQTQNTSTSSLIAIAPLSRFY